MSFQDTLLLHEGEKNLQEVRTFRKEWFGGISKFSKRILLDFSGLLHTSSSDAGQGQ